MLSRVADSLFWMSRYLERAEHTARVIGIQLNLVLERGAGSDDHDWARVLRCLGMELTEEEEAKAQAIAHSLLHTKTHRASLVACVVGARENARQVREQITSEMWEQLNRMFHSVSRAEEGESWEALEYLQSIKDGAHTFQGITDSTMTHSEGWHFIQAGRYLERSIAVSNLVGEHFREFHRPERQEPERAHLEWMGLLRSCTAFEPYCKAYTADLRAERIAEFLLLHPSFPHSIRFSVEALETAIKHISAEIAGKRSSKVERIAGRLRATLGFGQIDEIMSSGLDSYLESVLRQCGQVSGALYQTFISYPIEAALET